MSDDEEVKGQQHDGDIVGGGFTPNVIELDTPVAWRLWEAIYERSGIENEADDALIKTFGAEPDKPREWGFDDITYDPYDGSFELKGIENAFWAPTLEQLAEAWKLGFERCWFCYENGLERYCDPTYGIGNLKESLQSRIESAKRKASNEAGGGPSDEAQERGGADLVEKKLWWRLRGWFQRRPHA